MQNPIPFLSISKLTEKIFRDKINDTAKEVREEEQISANVFISVPETIFQAEIDQYIADEIIKKIEKKEHIKSEVSIKECPLIFQKIITSEINAEISKRECQINTQLIKDVVYLSNNKYYKKDFRIDSLDIKSLSFIKDRIDLNHQKHIKYEDRNETKIIDMSSLDKNLTEMQRKDLIIYNELILYKNGHKKSNKIEKKGCEELDWIKHYFINLNYKCEMLNFELTENIIKDVDGEYKIMNTREIDLYIKNIKLRI